MVRLPIRGWSGASEAQEALRSQTTRTLRASSPLRPGPISNSTVWPSFKRRFVVSALDIGAVDEDVIAVFSGDEAEALLGVEEFHGSCCQYSPSSPAQSLRLRPRRKPRRDTQPGTQPVGDSSPRDSARLRLAHMCRYGRVGSRSIRAVLAHGVPCSLLHQIG